MASEEQELDAAEWKKARLYVNNGTTVLEWEDKVEFILPNGKAGYHASGSDVIHFV